MEDCNATVTVDLKTYEAMKTKLANMDKEVMSIRRLVKFLEDTPPVVENRKYKYILVGIGLISFSAIIAALVVVGASWLAFILPGIAVTALIGSIID